MRKPLLEIAGIALTLLYSAFIIWVYSTGPASIDDFRTQASVVAGTYAVDQAKFQAGLELFRREQYRAARTEWMFADPGQRDAKTQFYIAYAFYREGWGHLRNDDALFGQGLDAANRAIALSGNNAMTVADPGLKIHSAVELKAELEMEMEQGWSTLNPVRIFRERK